MKNKNCKKGLVIELKPYDYHGGVHDGEWGVICKVNGEHFCYGMDVEQCLWRVLETFYDAKITHSEYTY